MDLADWVTSRQDLFSFTGYSDAASSQNSSFVGYEPSLGIGLLFFGVSIYAIKVGGIYNLGSPYIADYGATNAYYLGNNKWVLGGNAFFGSGDGVHIILQIISVDPVTLAITSIAQSTIYTYLFGIDDSLYFSHTTYGSFSETTPFPYMALISDGRLVVTHAGQGFFDLTTNIYRRFNYTKVFTLTGGAITEQNSIHEETTNETINAGGLGTGIQYLYNLNNINNSFIKQHLRGPGTSLNNNSYDSLFSVGTVDNSGNITYGPETRTNINNRFSVSPLGYFFGTGNDAVNDPNGNDHIYTGRLNGNIFILIGDQVQDYFPDDHGFWQWFAHTYIWINDTIYVFCWDYSSTAFGWHLNSCNVNTGSFLPKGDAITSTSFVSAYTFPFYLDVSNGVVTLLISLPENDSTTAELSVLRFPQNPPVTYSANINTTRVGFRSPTSRRNL